MAGLGSLVLSLVTDSTEFIKGLTKAEQTAAKAARNLNNNALSIAQGMLGAQVVTTAFSATMAAFGRTVESAGQAVDSAAAFGTTPEKFFAMKAAVESAGDSFAEMPSTLAKFSAALGDMTGTVEGKGRIIKELGLNLAELKTDDPVDALKKVSVALQTVEDPVLRAKLGAELLGKGFKDVAPALASFASATENTTGVTSDMLVQIDNAADSVGKFQTASSNATTIVLSQVAPAFTQLMNTFSDVDGQAGGLAGTLGGALATSFENIIVLARSAIFGANKIGDFIGATAAATVAKFKGDTAGVDAIRQAYIENDEAAAQKLGKFIDGIKGAREASAASLRQAKGDFSDITDLNARAAAAQAYGFAQLEKARIAKEQRGRMGGLTNTGGKPKQSDAARAAEADAKKITSTLEQMATAAATAMMKPADAQKYAFERLKGATSEQIAEHSKLVDVMTRSTAFKEFDSSLKGINAEQAALSRSEVDNVLAIQEAAFDAAGVSAEEAAERIAKMTAALMNLSASKFAKEVEAAQLAIEKLGKSEFEQKNLDIKANLKLELASGDDAVRMGAEKKLAKNLELNQEDFSKRAQLTMDEIASDMASKRMELVGTPGQKALAEFAKLVKENPQMAQFEEQVAGLQKAQAAFDEYATHVTEMRAGAKALGAEMVGTLGSVLDGSISAKDGLKNMTKALADMIIQAVLLRPLQKQINSFADSLFTPATGSKGAPAGGGGASAAAGGGIWESIKGFFGFAMGGSPSANSIVKVAEGGRPELYNSGGDSYLLTGAGGTVTPARSGAAGGSGGGGGNTFHFSIDARGADAGVDQKIRAAVAEAVQTSVATVAAKAGRGGAYSRQVRG